MIGRAFWEKWPHFYYNIESSLSLDVIPRLGEIWEQGGSTGNMEGCVRTPEEVSTRYGTVMAVYCHGVKAVE